MLGVWNWSGSCWQLQSQSYRRHHEERELLSVFSSNYATLANLRLPSCNLQRLSATSGCAGTFASMVARSTRLSAKCQDSVCVRLRGWWLGPSMQAAKGLAEFLKWWVQEDIPSLRKVLPGKYLELHHPGRPCGGMDWSFELSRVL